jgi:hypothetical protein
MPRFTEGTLYEAVAQGLAAIRGNEWVAGIAQGLNVVKVSVADVRVEHEVRLGDFTKWLEKAGGSPREVSERHKIRAILGMPVARCEADLFQPIAGIARATKLAQNTTATSRTLPWPASGWGCRGRRLSTARRNPGRPHGPLPYRPPGHGRGPARVAPAAPSDDP